MDNQLQIPTKLRTEDIPWDYEKDFKPLILESNIINKKFSYYLETKRLVPVLAHISKIYETCIGGASSNKSPPIRSKKGAA